MVLSIFNSFYGGTTGSKSHVSCSLWVNKKRGGGTTFLPLGQLCYQRLQFALGQVFVFVVSILMSEANFASVASVSLAWHFYLILRYM